MAEPAVSIALMFSEAIEGGRGRVRAVGGDERRAGGAGVMVLKGGACGAEVMEMPAKARVVHSAAYGFTRLAMLSRKTGC